MAVYSSDIAVIYFLKYEIPCHQSIRVRVSIINLHLRIRNPIKCKYFSVVVKLLANSVQDESSIRGHGVVLNYY